MKDASWQLNSAERIDSEFNVITCKIPSSKLSEYDFEKACFCIIAILYDW